MMSKLASAYPIVSVRIAYHSNRSSSFAAKPVLTEF
ncbi:Uncharacterised protein [BD1-7 clade bacterium]|uniref:Uncharacterized protein n=1 Tax=BD1-7 clade bacterium TaxID=2029982 RepID=A0A5S9QN83_9GAMM|nr:Uncharacterised protein [BD1-7 clade bacterium]CAA0116158.1 Uncharacterised protein [BD1-7 clade bacterium]CAA0119831.1 Uncharacterised protein [BD1-7 clade bacterium]